MATPATCTASSSGAAERCPVGRVHHARILGLLKIAHRRFYFRPRFVGRAVGGLASTAELKRLAQGALSIVKLELLNAKSRTAPV